MSSDLDWQDHISIHYSFFRLAAYSGHSEISIDDMLNRPVQPGKDGSLLFPLNEYCHIVSIEYVLPFHKTLRSLRSLYLQNDNSSKHPSDRKTYCSL